MLTLIKILSFIFTKLPPDVSLSIARILGRVYFFLDRRHRDIAKHNLRLAFCEDLNPREINKILKEYYLNVAQNMVEVLYSPSIDSGYIEKYVKIEGADYLREMVQKNKNVILISAHFGNWEVPNIICKYLFPDKPYFVLARDQGLGKVSALLDSYRQLHGYKILPINSSGLREVMVNLNKGSLLGMVIDQGIGRSAVLVDFFKHRVPAPTGAMKLAIKFRAPLILTYIRRIKGPYLELKIFPALELKNECSESENIQSGSQALNKSVERFIRQYPQNYLWQFKRFKNKLDRNIAILNDSKTGHLRQSQAVANILSRILENRGLIVNRETFDVEFKSSFAKNILNLTLRLFGFAVGLSVMRFALRRDSYERLCKACPDFVISAGSQTAGVNLILSKENQSKPVVIMKPSIFSTDKFKLVISPAHDMLPVRPNVQKITAAPNLINDEYLALNTDKIRKRFDIDSGVAGLKIGLLLGGDTKNFTLTRPAAEEVCDQIISAANEMQAQILVSSSRRTSREVEIALKNKFSKLYFCRLLIIASENNLPEAVGAILGSCQVIVVSADSISMVSEAVSSGKYIVVFNPRGQKNASDRHERFLRHLKDNGYIYLTGNDVGPAIKEIWRQKPAINKLQDNALIKQALEKII